MIPTNEQEVIRYYQHIQEQLGWRVIHIQRACPDTILQNTEGKQLRAEFEYKSRNFKYHKHNPLTCDLIICWQHNWPETPLPVWELKTMRSHGPKPVTQEKIQTGARQKTGGKMNDTKGTLKWEALVTRPDSFINRMRQLIRRDFGQAKSIKPISSYRAGALLIDVGERLDDARRKLSSNALRPYIAWEFRGAPFCYVDGHQLIVGANWPEHWCEDKVRLSDMQRRRRRDFSGLGESEWIVGIDLLDTLIKAGFGDQSPHWLFAGSSGAGKSVGLLNMLVQLLAKGGEAILIDGKRGANLKQAENIKGVIGPCAVTEDEALGAIEYAVNVMGRRYASENGSRYGWLYVVVDEFQELCKNSDFARNQALLAAQGRDAKIGLALVTQYPLLSSFGKDSQATKENAYGRIVYFLPRAKASEVAMDMTSPSATYLTGAGDCYACLHGVATRTQGLYADSEDVARLPKGEWEIQDWGSLYGPATQETATLATGNAKSATPLMVNNRTGSKGMKDIKPYELGATMLGVALGKGRPTVREWIHESGGTTGASRATAIKELYMGALGWINERGYLQEFAEAITEMTSVPD